jgi:hypothetical protein
MTGVTKASSSSGSGMAGDLVPLQPPPSSPLSPAPAPQVSLSQSPLTGQANGTTKEGWLRKRGARMHRWSTRYVILSGPKLSYKVKQDSATVRGAYDLVPGCILTEVSVSHIKLCFALIITFDQSYHRFRKKSS